MSLSPNRAVSLGVRIRTSDLEAGGSCLLEGYLLSWLVEATRRQLGLTAEPLPEPLPGLWTGVGLDSQKHANAFLLGLGKWTERKHVDKEKMGLRHPGIASPG